MSRGRITSGIEAQLSEIATEIVVTGELQYREHMQWSYETTLKHRGELRQQAIRRKLEEEKAERDRLLKLEADRLLRLVQGAAGHRKANDIGNFVASVIREAAAKDGDERAERWKDGALAQATRSIPSLQAVFGARSTMSSDGRSSSRLQNLQKVSHKSYSSRRLRWG